VRTIEGEELMSWGSTAEARNFSSHCRVHIDPEPGLITGDETSDVYIEKLTTAVRVFSKGSLL
jgi:hypothetical protein